MTTRAFDASELLIATHNRGKMNEFARMFGDRGIHFLCAADLGLPSPPETGTTFLENALTKARFGAENSGKVTLADDSGLCVMALDDAPGVYSADWAEKPDGTRDFNWAIEKLLGKLAGKTDRRAYFVSCLVLCWPDGHVEHVEAHAHGTILDVPRGVLGHGYDPLFLPDGHDKTYAEMDMTHKNKISHRAQAFSMLMEKCF